MHFFDYGYDFSRLNGSYGYYIGPARNWPALIAAKDKEIGRLSSAYAERLRAKGIPVVLGGSHVTFMAHEALKHTDFVIRREGHGGQQERSAEQ